MFRDPGIGLILKIALAEDRRHTRETAAISIRLDRRIFTQSPKAEREVTVDGCEKRKCRRSKTDIIVR